MAPVSDSPTTTPRPVAMAMPVKAAGEPSAPSEASSSYASDGTKAALLAMGFVDADLVDAVIAKNGDDLDACARDLASATEWDPLLDDLAEMGFVNRALNQ